MLDPPRLRLALARNDLAALRLLVDSIAPVRFQPYELDGPAAVLDSLVALGDGDRIEADAPQWLLPGTYVEPFALRALGVAREDGHLLGQAAGRFAAMDLEWHAAQTRRLEAGLR